MSIGQLSDSSRPIVVMGVSGSGKSTIAGLLAQRMGRPLLEGDSLHSTENVRRMSAGVPLGDAERHDWLAAIARRLADAANDGRGLVVACSALKRRYRDVLRSGAPRLLLVYLAGDRPLLQSRLVARQGHFMPAALLDSQLEALEPPDPDERAITCPIGEDARAIVERLLPLLRQT